MKALSLTRTLVLSTLVYAALLLAACDQSQEVKDTGPNANLSNEELLKKAVANMKAMKSYHFDLKGRLPIISLEMIPDVHMFGEMQDKDKGSRIRMTDESNTPLFRSNPDSAVPTPGPGVNIILTKGIWYESYDGGKTWGRPQISTPAYIWIATFGLVWDTRFTFEYPTSGEDMVKGLTFKDGNPRIERIDDITTRHILADMPRREGLAMQGAKRVDLWVSTEATPTIRQMKVEGSNTIDNIEMLYTLTWKWSRFNEDFGEVKAPPAETIKSP